MQQVTIGPHQVEYEDDIFLVRWRGTLEFEPFTQVYERLEEFIAERGYALALFDVHQSGLPGREARRWAGKWWRKQRPGTLTVAGYGMNAPVRTILMLSQRALVLLLGEWAPLTTLCSSETAARAWLAAQRAQLRATTHNPVK